VVCYRKPNVNLGVDGLTIAKTGGGTLEGNVLIVSAGVEDAVDAGADGLGRILGFAIAIISADVNCRPCSMYAIRCSSSECELYSGLHDSACMSEPSSTFNNVGAARNRFGLTGVILLVEDGIVNGSILTGVGG